MPNTNIVLEIYVSKLNGMQWKLFKQEGLSVEGQPPTFQQVCGRGRGRGGEFPVNKLEHVWMCPWLGVGAEPVGPMWVLATWGSTPALWIDKMTDWLTETTENITFPQFL